QATDGISMTRTGSDRIGPRGAVLLAVTAVAGIALGVHGWSVRNHAVPSSLASPRSSAPAATRPGHSATPAPHSSSVQGPARPSPSPSVSAGPKLSSQSFASYAFQVWPGAPSAAATAAETGLVIKVTRQGSG